MNSIGVYIHIPFCLSKCDYCDFCSKVDSTENIEKYVDFLIKEILDFEGNSACDTIYFGGGTPSILSARQLERIFNAIRVKFVLSESLEATIEVNPKTLTLEKMQGFKNAGINRVSIGLQSANDKLLTEVGRRHTITDFLETVALAKKFVDNISVDIILGLPKQTISDVRETLDLVAEHVKHVSCYALKVEEGTKLFEKGFKTDDDLATDMYDVCVDFLRGKGFRRYEVSNFAREGYECRHNLKYWRMEEYVGFGASSASFYNGMRCSHASTEKYLAGAKKKCETIDANEFEKEYIMLALRTSEGISLHDYTARFSRSFFEGREPEAEKLISEGFLQNEDSRLFLTDKGFYVMNSIIIKLFLK